MTLLALNMWLTVDINYKLQLDGIVIFAVCWSVGQNICTYSLGFYTKPLFFLLP